MQMAEEVFTSWGPISRRLFLHSLAAVTPTKACLDNLLELEKYKDVIAHDIIEVSKSTDSFKFTEDILGSEKFDFISFPDNNFTFEIYLNYIVFFPDRIKDAIFPLVIQELFLDNVFDCFTLIQVLTLDEKYILLIGDILASGIFFERSDSEQHWKDISSVIDATMPCLSDTNVLAFKTQLLKFAKKIGTSTISMASRPSVAFLFFKLVTNNTAFPSGNDTRSLHLNDVFNGLALCDFEVIKMIPQLLDQSVDVKNLDLAKQIWNIIDILGVADVFIEGLSQPRQYEFAGCHSFYCLSSFYILQICCSVWCSSLEFDNGDFVIELSWIRRKKLLLFSQGLEWY